MSPSSPLSSPLPSSSSSSEHLSAASCKGDDATTESFVQMLVLLQGQGLGQGLGQRLGLDQGQSNQASSSSAVAAVVAASVASPNAITIVVRVKDKPSIVLKAKRSTKLLRIFNSIAQSMSVDARSIRFMLNDTYLRSDLTVGDSGVQDGDMIDVVQQELGVDVDVVGTEGSQDGLMEENDGLSSLSPELRKELKRYRSIQRHAHLIDHYPYNHHAQMHMRRLLHAIDGCIAKVNDTKNKATNAANNSSSSTEAIDQAPPEVAVVEPVVVEPAVVVAVPAVVVAEPAASTAAIESNPESWGMAKWFAARILSTKVE